MTTVAFGAPLNSPRQEPADQLHAATKTTIEFTVTERDQVTAFDITGMTPTFSARVNFSDEEPLFEVEGTVTAGGDGECEVELPASAIPDPVELWAELALVDAYGYQVGAVAYFLPVRRGAS